MIGQDVLIDRVHWLAALLFGILLVLLILMFSWSLRAITPIDPAVRFSTVKDTAPAVYSLRPDPIPILKASLADTQADGKRLADEFTALAEDLGRKLEQCSSMPLPALPADRWSKKDLSVLQGCWYLGREAPTVRGEIGNPDREDCTSKVGRICFDAGGHGQREQTTNCPHAGTFFCSAPVVARFEADGSFSTTQPDIACQAGPPTNWYSRTLSCHRVDDSHASCRDSGRPELGLPAQDQEFRRTLK
jgi:hypothetical protein